MQADAVVDVAFPLRGDTLPADHGYLLYAALSRRLPAVHGDDRIGIHPIGGRLVGGRRLALTPASRLVLRLPAAALPEMIGLAGQQLDLAGDHLGLGFPAMRPLEPTAALTSRMVVIKGFMEADGFLDAARRQLAALDIQGEPSLLARTDARPFEQRSAALSGQAIRRTIRVHDKEIVGFAVQVDQLTAEESIRLQEAGLGGRRRFGCGIFVPARRRRG